MYSYLFSSDILTSPNSFSLSFYILGTMSTNSHNLRGRSALDFGNRWYPGKVLLPFSCTFIYYEILESGIAQRSNGSDSSSASLIMCISDLFLYVWYMCTHVLFWNRRGVNRMSPFEHML